MIEWIKDMYMMEYGSNDVILTKNYDMMYSATLINNLLYITNFG